MPCSTCTDEARCDRAGLCQNFTAAPHDRSAPRPPLSDEQIIQAFLARRPAWRRSDDWLVIGSAPAKELGDAIHTSDVIDAARAALAAYGVLGTLKENGNG